MSSRCIGSEASFIYNLYIEIYAGDCPFEETFEVLNSEQHYVERLLWGKEGRYFRE